MNTPVRPIRKNKSLNVDTKRTVAAVVVGPGFGLSPELRLRSPRDFTLMQRRGRQAYGKYLLTIIRFRDARQETAIHRLGLAVTKKVAPHAVKRNLFKRRLRDVFRHIRPHLTVPVDLLVIARQGSCEQNFSVLRDEFISSLIRERVLPAGTELQRGYRDTSK